MKKSSTISFHGSNVDDLHKRSPMFRNVVGIIDTFPAMLSKSQNQFLEWYTFMKKGTKMCHAFKYQIVVCPVYGYILDFAGPFYARRHDITIFDGSGCKQRMDLAFPEKNKLLIGDQVYTRDCNFNVKQCKYYDERRKFQSVRQLVECVLGLFSKFKIVSTPFRADVDNHFKIMIFLAEIINRRIIKKKQFFNKFLFFNRKKILLWDEQKEKEKKRKKEIDWIKEFSINEKKEPVVVFNF